MEKMKISKEVYDALVEWKEDNVLNYFPLFPSNLNELPIIVRNWWRYNELSYKEKNQRLITIIRWLNGKDVFEVEKPKKWVVHELNTELYVTTYDGHTGITPNRDYITKFDTKEEAKSWANGHQEVIEVEE